MDRHPNSTRLGTRSEVEPVQITGDGDVEALTVGDNRHRELVTQLRPGKIQRLPGSRDVGDHQVERLGDPIGQPQPGRVTTL